MKKVYPYIKVNREKNNITSIDVCKNDNCLDQGYKKPNPYELCKLINNNKISNKNQKITNLTPDCNLLNCLNRPYNFKDYSNTQFDDILIFNTIKRDDDKNLKNYINNNYSHYNVTINRKIQYPYPTTLIHESINNNSEKCFRLLLGYNIDISVRDKHHNTPIHLSCLQGFVLMTFMLIKHGADLSLTNMYGDTPLHCASISGNFDLIPMLINTSNANIHTLNKNNENPLFSAVKCKKKNLKIIKYLVENGSDIYLKNNNNLTLLKSIINDKSKNADEIRTYFKKIYFDKCNTNKEYNELLKQFPELSPYDMNKYNTKVDVEVEYDNDIEQPKYYNDKEYPIKKFKTNIEHFLVNSDYENTIYKNKVKFILIFIFLLLIIYKIYARF